MQLPSGEGMVAWTTAVGSSTDVGRWTDLGHALREEATELADELNIVRDRRQEKSGIKIFLAFGLEQLSGYQGHLLR